MSDSKIIYCVLYFAVQILYGVISTEIGVSDFKRFIHPEVIASEHTTVTLECHSKSTAVATWWYQSQYGDRERDISSAAGRIMSGYKHRFQLDKPWLGDYNLVINSTRLSDAGLYTCIEDGGFGDRHIIKLTVLEASVVDLVLTVSTPLVGGKTTTHSVLLLVTGDRNLPDNEMRWKWIAISFITIAVVTLAVLVVVICSCSAKRCIVSERQGNKFANEQGVEHGAGARLAEQPKCRPEDQE